MKLAIAGRIRCARVHLRCWLHRPSAQRLPPELRASIAAKTAMNRTGAVEEVANVVHFLLSDEAAFVTGSIYEVNGGQTQL